MHHTTHADAGETHVGEDLEVVGLADLVVDRVVGTDHQENVGGVFHAAFEFRVLSHLGADL